MQTQAIKAVINTFGLLLLTYVLVFFSWEGSKLVRWSGSGRIDTDFELVDERAWVTTEVDSSDFAGPFVPARGDTLIAIGDTLTGVEEIRTLLFGIHTPGERHLLRFQRAGSERVAELLYKPVAFSRALPFFILQVLRLLIILSFIGIGLFAFHRRSDSAGVRTLALFSFTVAAFMLTMISVLNAQFAAFQIPFRNEIEQVLRVFWPFVGGLWLTLQLLFPRRSTFLIRTRNWGYLIVFLPQLALLILGITDRTGLTNAFSSSIAILTTAQFAVGFGLLARHYLRAESVLERRQTRLVLYGSAIGLISLTMLFFIGAFFTGWFTARTVATQLAMINGTFLALLLTPVSLAYAFGKYRLLEVEGKLRRGTRYLLTTSALLAIFFLVAYLLGELLIRNLGITSRTPILLFAMLLGLGISPVQRRFIGLLERQFFPERYRLRVMIDDFIQRLGSFPDRDTLFQQLEQQLHQSVGVEKILAIFAESDGGYLTLDGKMTPFHQESEIIQEMIRTGRPLLMDEAMASLRIPFSDLQLQWIQTHRIILVLPMFARLRLTGFLALGSAHRDSDFTPEVVDLLAGLVGQVALSTENLNLLEENLEKRRLEEQLQLARDIQIGLLPREIPPTPGLDVAARCRFSLEVAGDYYDVIVLRDGRTVVAVGDVSGKGAGAALIMANLQASLRTAIKSGTDLAELVSRINDLIFQNTPAEQYITFFVAVFDPAAGKLSYVNAGHNPPILFRQSGSLTQLERGGLVLGALPDREYLTGEETLAEGDSILLYTDGVTEAFNRQGDEFGEERLHSIVLSQDGAPPRDVVDRIEAEVIAFHGDQELQDDCTLLMVKRQGQ